jgi:hypothetical protein
MDVNTSLLSQFLFWIAGGVGSGAITYVLFERVAVLKSLAPLPKRVGTLALSAVLAMGAFAAAVGLGYFDQPSGWQGWLEALFAVAFVAVGGSQLIHGAKKLPR